MASKSISQFTNYIIGGVLLCLTLLTYVAALFDLGVGNLIIGLLIAAAKATLIVLYFMHARHGNKLIWVVICSALLWFGILMVLTMSDYATRHQFL